jgi:hypothetical protein
MLGSPSLATRLTSVGKYITIMKFEARTISRGRAWYATLPFYFSKQALEMLWVDVAINPFMEGTRIYNVHVNL